METQKNTPIAKTQWELVSGLRPDRMLASSRNEKGVEVDAGLREEAGKYAARDPRIRAVLKDGVRDEKDRAEMEAQLRAYVAENKKEVENGGYGDRIEDRDEDFYQSRADRMDAAAEAEGRDVDYEERRAGGREETKKTEEAETDGGGEVETDGGEGEVEPGGGGSEDDEGVKPEADKEAEGGGDDAEAQAEAGGERKKMTPEEWRRQWWSDYWSGKTDRSPADELRSAETATESESARPEDLDEDAEAEKSYGDLFSDEWYRNAFGGGRMAEAERETEEEELVPELEMSEGDEIEGEWDDEEVHDDGYGYGVLERLRNRRKAEKAQKSPEEKKGRWGERAKWKAGHAAVKYVVLGAMILVTAVGGVFGYKKLKETLERRGAVGALRGAYEDRYDDVVEAEEEKPTEAEVKPTEAETGTESPEVLNELDPTGYVGMAEDGKFASLIDGEVVITEGKVNKGAYARSFAENYGFRGREVDEMNPEDLERAGLDATKANDIYLNGEDGVGMNGSFWTPVSLAEKADQMTVEQRAEVGITDEDLKDTVLLENKIERMSREAKEKIGRYIKGDLRLKGYKVSNGETYRTAVVNGTIEDGELGETNMVQMTANKRRIVLDYENIHTGEHVYVAISCGGQRLNFLPETEDPTEPSTEITTETTTEETTEEVTEPSEPETEDPTEPPTEAETEVPTEPETLPPTEDPTEPATQPPTEPVTQPPTQPVTNPPTERPTEPVTQPPTEPITQPPTEPITRPPTEPPTEQVTLEGKNDARTPEEVRRPQRVETQEREETEERADEEYAVPVSQPGDEVSGTAVAPESGASLESGERVETPELGEQDRQPTFSEETNEGRVEEADQQSEGDGQGQPVEAEPEAAPEPPVVEEVGTGGASDAELARRFADRLVP